MFLSLQAPIHHAVVVAYVADSFASTDNVRLFQSATHPSRTDYSHDETGGYLGSAGRIFEGVFSLSSRNEMPLYEYCYHLVSLFALHARVQRRYLFSSGSFLLPCSIALSHQWFYLGNRWCIVYTGQGYQTSHADCSGAIPRWSRTLDKFSVRVSASR